MSLVYFTRRAVRFAVSADRQGIAFAWWVWNIAVRTGRRLKVATTDLHATALRRVRNKARVKHIQLAKDYSRLQDMHTNVEKQLASVRQAAINELLRVGDQTSAIEDAVHIELKQLGKND